MHCPFCESEDTRVIDSRLVAKGAEVRRRRECAKCGNRFTSYETASLTLPRVRKRDGCSEPFDETKFMAGIARALEKRPVSEEQRRELLQNVMDQIRKSGEREIESRELGEMIMQMLKALDSVAYVRFASVYRNFQDVSDFQEEIRQLDVGQS
ncbi:MAG: transcriptional regulator NrdR [Gammaproteobacteria bacterium]|nr:transcriptional regulator NrdR [Gammaproteobacteria bacterium]MCY4199205.1 transcriptional regulator NrdR [Gammaproteobacteria bacterium]MCY4323472.1 transcriptional regulator NrdR [Gammaproteobacteria bacterium]